MTRIVVVYTHRHKRPSPKKKAPTVKIAAGLVVHAPKAAGDEHGKKSPHRMMKLRSAADTPGRQPLPTVVVAASGKRLKRMRTERWAAQPREPSPEVEAFFTRNVRPGGPQPPRKP